MGDRWAGDTATTGNVSGAKHPRLWPATLEAEDAVRAAGHLTLTPGEWLQLYRDSSTVQYSTVHYSTVVQGQPRPPAGHHRHQAPGQTGPAAGGPPRLHRAGAPRRDDQHPLTTIYNVNNESTIQQHLDFYCGHHNLQFSTKLCSRDFWMQHYALTYLTNKH